MWIIEVSGEILIPKAVQMVFREAFLRRLLGQAIAMVAGGAEIEPMLQC
jgi:hypothetical protein